MSVLSKVDSFDAEKNDYIVKLRNTVEVLEKILGLSSSTLISEEKKQNLEVKLRESKILLKKLENNEYEIAIVGLEKAGKSSFANALIRSMTLPTDEQRCTYTATRIEYSEKNEAVVSFFSRSEFERDFKEKLYILGIPNAEKYNFDVMSVAKYEELCEECYDPNNRNHYIVNQDIIDILENSRYISECLGRPSMTFSLKNDIEELNNYIVKPEKARAVKEVVIRSSALNDMKNAVVYDVPGFNSPTALHKQQTLDKMKSADAIIVVAKGDEPSITGDVLEIIRKNNDDDGIPLKDKLFVFANKADRAQNIEKNISITYKEWIDKHKILTEKEKSRIFFGSANAYLQACRLIEGSEFVEAIKKRPELKNGDGIDSIRVALAEYNQNERFEVLKRRINRTGEELVSTFSSVNSEYSESMDNLSVISNKEYYEYISSYKEAVIKSLEDFKDKLKQEIPSEQPLSNSVRDYIRSTVTSDTYKITEEEIDEERKRNIVISNITDVDRIERNLRDKRFVKMYQDFTENVVNITDDQHIDCMNNIINILIDAMGIEDNLESKKIMTEKVKQLVKEFTGSDDTYYQSIIERFSRDIYEILIQCPQYSEFRLKKFNAEMDNFYSLSVFYKNPDFVKSEYDYINIPPKEQPLCMMLLFSYYFDLPQKVKQCENKVLSLTGVKKLAPKALSVLTKAVRIYNGDVVELFSLIEQIFANFNFAMSDEGKDNWIDIGFEQLDRAVSDENSVDVSDKENFRTYYIKYGQGIRTGEKTTKDFCDEFDKDIEILADILLNAFVNAIKLEKPFITREIKIIEDIISYINRNVHKDSIQSFNDFMSENLPIIKSDSYLKKEHQKKVDLQNIAVLDQINRLLGSLRN